MIGGNMDLDLLSLFPQKYARIIGGIERGARFSRSTMMGEREKFVLENLRKLLGRNLLQSVLLEEMLDPGCSSGNAVPWLLLVVIQLSVDTYHPLQSLGCVASCNRKVTQIRDSVEPTILSLSLSLYTFSLAFVFSPWNPLPRRRLSVVLLASLPSSSAHRC